mmetsp:Transcript_10583/g.18743  ORF Transcript_10583/g.18743 Transcript_10583/m.18743 type:complete len:292 (+) Transcript_10583:11-886(+)
MKQDAFVFVFCPPFLRKHVLRDTFEKASSGDVHSIFQFEPALRLLVRRANRIMFTAFTIAPERSSSVTPNGGSCGIEQASMSCEMAVNMFSISGAPPCCRACIKNSPAQLYNSPSAWLYSPGFLASASWRSCKKFGLTILVFMSTPSHSAFSRSVMAASSISTCSAPCFCVARQRNTAHRMHRNAGCVRSGKNPALDCVTYFAEVVEMMSSRACLYSRGLASSVSKSSRMPAKMVSIVSIVPCGAAADKDSKSHNKLASPGPERPTSVTYCLSGTGRPRHDADLKEVGFLL